jgi:hypothetical protein
MSFKFLKRALGLTAARVRIPAQAGRWARIVMAAHAQLLLAVPVAAGLRRPWENQPDPARSLTPGRVAAGFATSTATWEHPPVSRNPPAPDPDGPKAAARARYPATCCQAKPTCHAQ